MAAGDVGELALEGGGERNSAAEFYFGRCRGQGGVMRRRGAIDDEEGAWQRLEGRRVAPALEDASSI
jgi:hypothetical protein